jgi:hypothetical protein
VVYGIEEITALLQMYSAGGSAGGILKGDIWTISAVGTLGGVALV